MEKHSRSLLNEFGRHETQRDVDEAEEGNWIGVHRRHHDCAAPCTPQQVARSDWGGIVDQEAWQRLYNFNTKHAGRDDKVGRWVDVRTAMEVLRAAIETRGQPAHEAAPSSTPEEELIGSDIGNRTVWDSGARCFTPKAGCFTDFKAPDLPQQLQEEYSPGEKYGAHLLPLVLEQYPAKGKDEEALDRIFQGYLDAGAIAEWTADKGLPTVVTPVAVIWQGLPGKEKPRVIVDYRYVNGAIPATPLMLPTVVEIAKCVREGDRVAKEDLKTGYHQIRMRTKDRHLCTTIWRGKLYAFTCMTFGLRDAPGEFQRRTEYVAGAIKRDLRIPVSEVYLDDFMQICEDAQYEEILGRIAQFGFIMGKKKCARPVTMQEVLGLEIDTVAMQIRAPKAKVAALQLMLTDYATCSTTTTKALARTLGMLVAVEPAIPHAMLLSRPLYDDLKDVLVEGQELNDYSEVTIDRHGNFDSGYAWRDIPMQPSIEGVAAARILAEKITSLNGQNIKIKNAKIVIRTDASERGIGRRIFVVGEQGEKTRAFSVSGPLPATLLEKSSIAREAHAFATTCELAPDDVIEGNDILGVVDNKGLTKRFWCGARDRLVNVEMTRLSLHLMKRGSRAQRMLWTPRVNMDAEDALSRRDEFVEPTLRVTEQWFAEWCARTEVKPTIDAFASRTDARLKRYVCVDGSSGYLDGASFPWGREEVPWAFPPLSIAARAMRNWIRSESTTSYWCLADVTWGQWHTLLSRPDIEARVIERRVPVAGA